MSNPSLLKLDEMLAKNKPADKKYKIAILGAPGSGKTTLSAGLLYHCKLMSLKVDWVPEVAKWHFYRGADMTSLEFEFQKFKEQLELESIFPENLDILICEAPMIISAVYASFYHGDHSQIAEEFFNLAKQNLSRYSHYVVLKKSEEYEEFGRHQSEDEALAIHNRTIEILDRLGVAYTVYEQGLNQLPQKILSDIGVTQAPAKRLGESLFQKRPQSLAEQLFKSRH